MDPSITDVASYLATAIPTGSETEDGAREDWRGTLHNARRTKSMSIVSDMVARSAPEDDLAQFAMEYLKKRDA